jgi:hypothetical protein
MIGATWSYEDSPRDSRRRGNFCRGAAVYLGIAIISGATRYRKNDAPSLLANASINILKKSRREGRAAAAAAEEEERGAAQCPLRSHYLIFLTSPLALIARRS